MPHRPWKNILAVCVLLILYIFGLSRVGLIGPDEPRYASIGREMARSNDWVTPRLWGEPWFEKPALLYWLIGAGYTVGLGDDLAPRLPVAILSVAFLLFFFARVRREFGERPAWYASAILATTAGWLAFSQVAVTDLPLAAAFSAAMLLCLPWVRSGGRRGLLIGGVLLGLAVLAKGLVPLVLSIPLLWVGRRRWKDLLALGAACVLTAAPWYLLCTLRNGEAFLEEFFLRHHFSRFSSDVLMHTQPFWFYVPVLLGSVFPWTPLLVFTFKRESLRDSRRLLLALIVIFGFAFFSLSENKLPGYLLPLLPSIAVLAGIGLAEARSARVLLASCALLLVILPAIAAILPQALLTGLSRAEPGDVSWLPAVFAIAAAPAAWYLDARKRRNGGVAIVAVATALGVLHLKLTTYPIIDELVSARTLWERIEPRRGEICVENIHRIWQYGLNFYAEEPLPDCSEVDTKLRLVPGRHSRPEIVDMTDPGRQVRAVQRPAEIL